MNQVERLIRDSLKTIIPPMVYILMAVSVFIGFCFATGLLLTGSDPNSVLYDAGVLIDKQLWGGILFSTATIAEVGFVMRQKACVLIGGMAGFMAWLFASISLAMDGHWYVLVSVGLLHLLFHGYVYLAASLGYLERGLVDEEYARL